MIEGRPLHFYLTQNHVTFNNLIRRGPTASSSPSTEPIGHMVLSSLNRDLSPAKTASPQRKHRQSSQRLP